MAGATLFLVRHAIAEERGASWPDDSLRPLSKKGVAKFEKAVEGFARLGDDIDLILTSPFVRARQTAEILAAGLDSKPSIVEIESLEPDGKHEALMADLAKHARNKAVALVGHEPSLGRHAGRLIGSAHALEFKKGAICRIDIDADPPGQRGRLRWFLTPKMLKRLR